MVMEFKCVHEDFAGRPQTEITYIIHDDADLHAVMTEFRRFLLAASFQPGSIDEYIKAE